LATHEKRPLKQQQPEQVDNSIIADKNKFLNTLFKDLSGLIEVAEKKNEIMKKKYFNNVKELQEYNPPQDKEVYFGVFTRNFKSGKERAVNKTQAIWLDFDDISEPYGLELMLQQHELPLPSIIVDSGHGLHAYWVLDEPAGREVKPVIKKLINITGADSSAKNLNRLMRLPGTMNVKYEPVRCKVFEITNKRFNLADLADLLQVKAEAKPQPTITAESLKIDYQGIVEKVEKPCIKNIMQGVEVGERNWLLGRLVKYLQLELSLSKKDARKVVRVWNQMNEEAQNEQELLASFNDYWHTSYNLLGCYITDKEGDPLPDKQQILDKYCDRKNCKLAGKMEFIEGQENIEMNNRLINKIKGISTNSFIIYSILFMNKSGLTASKGAKIMGVSKRTFKRNIKELIKLGYAKKKKGIPQRGIADLYYLTKQGTFSMGRTMISYAAIRTMLAELRTGNLKPIEVKIYLLLRYYEYKSKTNEVYPSTTTLAEKLGSSRQKVSKHVNRLEQRDYIEIDREKKRSNLYKFKIR